MKPKPQQSTLAFAKPKTPMLDNVEDLGTTRRSELAAENVSEGVEEKEETLGQSDASSSIQELQTSKKYSKLKAEVSDESGNEDSLERIPKSIDETTESHESSKNPIKRRNNEFEDDENTYNDDSADDDEPVRKRSRRGKYPKKHISTKSKSTKTSDADELGPEKKVTERDISPSLRENIPKTVKEHQINTDQNMVNGNKDDGGVMGEAQVPCEAFTAEISVTEDASEVDEGEVESEEDKPELAEKAREKVQSSLKANSKDPYPDWPLGDPVPYAALCATFSLVEMTTKRLVISAHCSLFLRQVLRLTPEDLLPTVQLMINKLAADYAGIELGIGESLIMKAIGETTGRSLQVIKADQKEIGDLGLVAAKSRSNQPTMYKPKALTVKGVLNGLMGIATVSGDGSQARKVAGIKKLLSAADASLAGKGSKGIDITKDKGGASEAKFIIRFLEGKLRLGLAEKTVLVALAHAMVVHETCLNGNKVASSEQLAKGESILKTVYR